LGLGITPWSPLGSGLLSGKYRREGINPSGEGRLPAVAASGNPGFEKLLTEQNWKIVDTLVGVAREMGKSPAQVALAWVASRPGVTSTIIGATKLEQLEANLGALGLEIPAPLQQRLDAVSAPPLVHPYHFFQPTMQAMIRGGTSITAEPGHFR
jgi:aryl-alcohol dehydrogenase-like predicted oxidoreductase